MNEMPLDVAVILAGTRGIGAAIANRLAKNRAKILVSGRSEADGLLIVDALKEKGASDALFFPGDLGDSRVPGAVVEMAIQKWGYVSVLINNCGGPKRGAISSLSDEDWIQAFNVTFLSYVRAFRASLPSFKEKHYGRVVNIVSSSSRQMLPLLGLSNCLRPGVNALTKTLAIEHGRDGILINAIAPGKISTDRTNSLDRERAAASKTSFEALRESVCREIPIGRYGTPEEVAELANFLVSSSNTYITGQCILVDGGWVSAL